MKARWRDFIDPTSPISFVVVQPAPPHLEPSISAHVLLIQHELHDQSSPLVTVYDSAINQGMPFRVVLTLNERTTIPEVINALGYTRDCQCPGTTCALWIERLFVQSGSPLAVRDGNCIVVQVTRTMLPADWQPPIVPETPGTEGLNFLQTRASRVSLTEPHDRDHSQTDEVRLELKPAIVAFEWIDMHLFLPSLVVPEGVQLLPASRHWVDLPPWMIGQPCDAIWIYLDGSFRSEEKGAGIGVAAFIRAGTAWFSAGMISSCIQASDSYTPEVAAALVASKFAVDLAKQVLFAQTSPCEIWIGFDSLTVGQQMAGAWNSYKAPMATSAMRSLHRLIEARFGIKPQSWHIPSHKGEPGNELVDALAESAARDGGLHDVKPFLDYILSPACARALEWMWILFDPSYSRHWQETCLCLPKHPTTIPSTEVLPQNPVAAPPTDEVLGRYTLTLGTCNVLTLKGKEDHVGGIDGISRQDAILEQFKAQGVHILALQETRLRKLYRSHDPRYVLVKSAATSNGCYGILLGFSRLSPHGWLQKPTAPQPTPVYFQETHISVIAAEPRVLVVRLRTPVVRCIVVAAHAPHTGHTDDSVKEWRIHVGKLVPPRYNDWPRLLLCDANARVGSVVTPYIGGHQPETETPKSEFFRSFLGDQGLWLPCTFDSCQHGPGGTWLHTNGTWLRGDFIGIPVQWNFTHCKAFVSDVIDVATLKEDHRAAIVQLEGACPSGSYQHATSPLKLHDDQNSLIDATDFLQIQRPELSVDVHTHAYLLQQQIIQILGRRPCPRRRKPRKTNMTEVTWNLVCEKRDWRNHLWEAQDLQRQTVLRLCFQSLKDPGMKHCSATMNRIIAQQDSLIAQALFQFRNLGRQVVKAMRADDVAFFRSLAQDAGDFVQPHQAKELWKVIRRSLPKFQHRRMHTPPERLESLEDQWHPYFQHLEAGSFVSAPDLVSSCHRDQMANGSVQPVCELCDVPSLQQIEEMFRCTQKGKSTGLDPIASALYHVFPTETARLFFDLILKIYLWQAEPIAYKGGVMAVIPERMTATLAQHFCGIMLLPSVAKRVHAILRLSTIQLIERIKPQGQIGGFKHQQVGFASQALRTFCRVANQHGFSTGVLFVDLSNAFHRLVRELVCGVGSAADAQAVIDLLERDHGTQQGLRAWLRVPGLLERLGASPILVQLMREVHTNTWHTLASQPVITRTRRGTRPGSPLADVVFHVLMLDIVTEINAWIEMQPEFQDALQRMDVDIDSIVWSDDLAIPWCTETATALVPALRELLTVVDRFFTRRGFDLNMDRGKTGIVLTFQGHGAPALRQEFLLCEPSGFWCQLDGERHHWVHVSATYRHLGSQFASKLDFTEEVKYRIGQAAAAFCAMRRQVFCNKYIPVKIRLRLFQALVCTRLYFGLGAWPTPTAQQLHQLRKTLAHYLCSILATGRRFSGKRQSDGQIFAEAGFLEPRIRLAQD